MSKTEKEVYRRLQAADHFIGRLSSADQKSVHGMIQAGVLRHGF